MPNQPLALIAPTPFQGGLQFRDAAPMIASVVDNGVCEDDPRILVRLNQATKMILDTMIPVGGMATFAVSPYLTDPAAPVLGPSGGPFLLLPPQLENAIDVVVVQGSVRGSTDVAQGWYEIVNQSVFIDPNFAMDNPLIDRGLIPDPVDPSVLRRLYEYPGLAPANAVVHVTGAKRFIPLTTDSDYLIVQNIEAIRLMILYIERMENNAVDDAMKYRQSSLELLQAEVKKHLLDPRMYMRRKSAYEDDLITFADYTLGNVRAQIALDIDEAMKTGKSDLTWSINKAEQRLMQRGIFKDCIIQYQAVVTGGMVYFPINVQTVLAADFGGVPIPIRSEFFQYLDNGPGMFPCHSMLIDQGDEYFPGTQTTRRKYKLIADCSEGQCLQTVCKLRWRYKKPNDLMVIKNYEAIRMMMTAKFLEEKEQWQPAQANVQAALDILEKELREYLGGIRHTIHVQTVGFGMGDIGGYWGQ
jgi:hypothetical protein